MPHDGEGLAGFHAEGDIAEDPVFVCGFRDVSIAEPHIAKFDFAAGAVERDGVRVRFDGYGLIEQFEDAFRSGHGGLEDVEFLAEILNGAEKALGKHGEGGQNTESKRAGKNTIAAGPKNQSNGGEAEKFDGGVKKSVSENSVAPGKHVVAIALLKFLDGFAFAVEELHDAHAGDVFLKESVDAGNGGADAAIGIANEFAKNHGDDEDAGKDSEGGERKAGVDFEEQAGHDDEEKEVVDHGDDAGSEKIVEGVDIRGDAGDQAADGIAVEIAHRQALHVAEDFAAHVVHGLLADALHDANLDVLGEEVERQNGKKEHSEPADARPRGCFRDHALQCRSKVAINSFAKDQRGGKLERRDDGHHDEREDHAPFVRLHVLQKPAHQARIVRFAEGFFFVKVAHARSSSSSSNCL